MRRSYVSFVLLALNGVATVRSRPSAPVPEAAPGSDISRVEYSSSRAPRPAAATSQGTVPLIVQLRRTA